MNAKIMISSTGKTLSRAERAPNGAWQVTTPIKGLDFNCLAADPCHPNILYAGTQGQGVLRSQDTGKTWHPAGLEGQIVKSLAVSAFPGDGEEGPGTVYAGTKSPASIFKSASGGKDWSELAAFRRIPSRWFWFSPAESPFTAYVQGIALSPVDPKLIVAGVEAGAVVRSQDGGESWSDHRPGAVRDCHSIEFHAAYGDWVYEGGGTGPAFSRDAGKTWRQPKGGLDRKYCWAVTSDPAAPEVWYVSASPGPFKAHGEGDAQAYIFRSVGGAPWEKLAGGLPQPLRYMPYALVTDRSAPGHLYAALSCGDVWFSENHGDDWEQLPINLGGIQRAFLLTTTL